MKEFLSLTLGHLKKIGALLASSAVSAGIVIGVLWLVLFFARGCLSPGGSGGGAGGTIWKPHSKSGARYDDKQITAIIREMDDIIRTYDTYAREWARRTVKEGGGEGAK